MMSILKRSVSIIILGAEWNGRPRDRFEGLPLAASEEVWVMEEPAAQKRPEPTPTNERSQPLQQISISERIITRDSASA